MTPTARTSCSRTTRTWSRLPKCGTLRSPGAERAGMAKLLAVSEIVRCMPGKAIVHKTQQADALHSSPTWPAKLRQLTTYT
eukprot:358521-Chlamydomonas_euryale.AAC.9